MSDGHIAVSIDSCYICDDHIAVCMFVVLYVSDGLISVCIVVWYVSDGHVGICILLVVRNLKMRMRLHMSDKHNAVSVVLLSTGAMQAFDFSKKSDSPRGKPDSFYRSV
jgi:hypothetical protein